MKILQEGIKPAAPWWVGLKLTCDCGCQIELEEGDFKGDPSLASTLDRNNLCVTCPCCKNGIRFKSTQPWYPDDTPRWPERPPYTLGNFDPQCQS